MSVLNAEPVPPAYSAKFRAMPEPKFDGALV